MFEREKYYSQTEACKKYKISIKMFKHIIKDLAVTENPITLHTAPEGLPFYVTATYVLKEEFDLLVKE